MLLRDVYRKNSNDMMRKYQDVYDRGMSHIRFGSATKLNDWSYSGDTARALLLAADALSSEKSSQVAGEVFFITNNHPVPFCEISNTVLAQLAAADPNRKPEKKPVQLPQAVVYLIALVSEWAAWLTGKEVTLTRNAVKFMFTTRVHSTEKARRVLGYEPTATLDDTVKEMVDVGVLNSLPYLAC
jgi:sterol-4alpha-carboxylate 3-dehydrogenase (decarboxylating)